MRLDFSNTQQFYTFLLAIALGAVYCLAYDIVRFTFSGYKSGGLVVFLVDVLYFLIIGVTTFVFFVLLCKGVIRVYVFIGIGIGFFIFRLLLSPLIRCILKCIEKFIKILFSLIMKPIEWLISLLGKLFEVIAVNLRKIALWILDKFKKVFNKLLVKISNKNGKRSPKANKKPKKTKKVT